MPTILNRTDGIHQKCHHPSFKEPPARLAIPKQDMAQGHEVDLMI